MSQYLGRGLILTPVTFSYGGKSITAPVVVDSGAEGFAAVDRPFAEKLGIPLTLAGFAYGVGGSTLSWNGKLDKMKLKDVPACSVDGVTVGVSDIPLLRPNAVALLGLNFMSKTGATIRFAPGKVTMECPGGPGVDIPITALAAGGGHADDDGQIFSPATIIAAGVGILAIIGLLVYLSID